MGLAIGAMAPSTEAASALGPAVMVIWIVFGGYYVNQENVPRALRWLPSASLIKNGFQVRLLACDACMCAAGMHLLYYPISVSSIKNGIEFPTCLRACESCVNTPPIHRYDDQLGRSAMELGACRLCYPWHLSKTMCLMGCASCLTHCPTY